MIITIAVLAVTRAKPHFHGVIETIGNLGKFLQTRKMRIHGKANAYKK